MSVTVSITPKLEATRTESLIAGVSGGNVSIALPSSTVGSQTRAGGAVAITCTKLWTRVISLASSTPETLDLTALTGGKGDTSFSAVKLVDVRNNEAADSGEVLAVGGAASTPFLGFLGAADDTLKVDPGCARTLYTRASAGWSTAGANNLKLDPGANAISVTVTIAGD
ncbi:hypothetical protein [Tautonia plasticadhaerens]|uniref:Uncharacterized protein n=1 Tax=Tautonia plasticadhaerens TaxID=2527974 RepID=A0A518GZM1_9BACT|nr:hypothetical protein [Tautonia plasticadhaerens]QDV34027.1 hypothetical protein ElP_19080 [Tautonia plasticadhaerens]